MINSGETYTRIAIIGAGFSGLGMAIRLKKAGIEDYTVFERADEVGGTWRDNTYPGAACDVPSHLYSFSFAPNPDWGRAFSRQEEIQRYLVDCSARFGVRSSIRFGHKVTAARWDEARDLWRIETTRGNFAARVLIAGAGPLSEPAIPELPGLDAFEGKVFHSAQWDHGYDLSGKRVAVVGTGASAIQFVPQIQPKVARLHVFQRTPPWITPRLDRPYSALEKRLFRQFPILQRLTRGEIYWSRELLAIGLTRAPALMKGIEYLARRHLKRQVKDAALRRKLTPGYTIGCKRILISNDYYPSLAKPNVEVITSGVKEVGPNWVLARDGERREVDAIVFGTGFHVTDMPAASHIYGKGGRLLADDWSRGMEAYLGTAVAGYPNLFFLIGPNTGLGHNSMVYMIESQLNYLVDAVRRMDKTGEGVVEVREDAQRAYNGELQSKMGRTVWIAGGCASWYLDKNGRNTTLWPDFTWRFRERTRRFDADAYDRRAARAP